MRVIKVISLFLGASMFAFGFLKFFNPFKTWYSVQIVSSGLGRTSYALGIVGELLVGLSFLALILYRKTLSSEAYVYLSVLTSFAVIVMMSTGTYVHLHPNVPAEVLPLKIKPPFIPLFFLAAACINIVMLLKEKKAISSNV
jgi:hypothetical protein